MQSRRQEKAILQKIRELPEEKLAEVEDFIDFLASRGDRRLVQAAALLSEASLKKVWDNPDDAVFDKL